MSSNLKFKDLSSFQKILVLTFCLMIFFLPVHANFWELFDFNFPIKPSEIFIIIFIFTSFLCKSISFKKDLYNILAVVWVAVNYFSLISAGFTKHVLVELAKPTVLFVMFLFIRCFLEKFGVVYAAKSFILSVLFSACLAIGGWLFNIMGYRNVLVWQMKDYPYFGPIGRAQAFTSTPNMLGSLLMLGLVLVIYLWLISKCKKERTKLAAIFLIFSLTFVLAISKTIVVMFGLILLILSVNIDVKKVWVKYLLRVVAITSFVIYIGGSHYVFDFSAGKGMHGSQKLGYVAEGQSYGNVYIAPTAYTMIKNGCIEVFWESPLIGVGAGQYNSYSSSLVDKGIYNESIGAYDPHCTILGTMTELGLIGGFVLLVWFVVILCKLNGLRLEESKEERIQLLAKLLLILLFGISIEAFVTDVMNFRQYWLLYAFISYFLTTEGLIQSSNT